MRGDRDGRGCGAVAVRARDERLRQSILRNDRGRSTDRDAARCRDTDGNHEHALPGGRRDAHIARRRHGGVVRGIAQNGGAGAALQHRHRNGRGQRHKQAARGTDRDRHLPIGPRGRHIDRRTRDDLRPRIHMGAGIDGMDRNRCGHAPANQAARRGERGSGQGIGADRCHHHAMLDRYRRRAIRVDCNAGAFVTRRRHARNAGAGDGPDAIGGAGAATGRLDCDASAGRCIRGAGGEAERAGAVTDRVVNGILPQAAERCGVAAVDHLVASVQAVIGCGDLAGGAYVCGREGHVYGCDGRLVGAACTNRAGIGRHASTHAVALHAGAGSDPGLRVLVDQADFGAGRDGSPRDAEAHGTADLHDRRAVLRRDSDRIGGNDAGTFIDQRMRCERQFRHAGTARHTQKQP